MSNLTRLYSPNLERLALRSVTSGDDRVAGWILPRLNAEHFSLDATNEAFKRLQVVIRKEGKIPHWDELLDDLVISQDSREELAEFNVEPVSNRKVARRLIARLDRYRRARIFMNMARHTGKRLEDGRIDLDELADQVGDMLAKARSSNDLTESMMHVGDERLDKKFINRLLNESDEEFVPTGFRAFDSRNQGIPKGACVVMAANTGGGKSLMLITLAIFQARIGQRFCIVSLEMPREHVVRRILSALTGMPLSRINRASSLTEADRDKLYDAWVDFHKQVRRNGGRLTILAPDEDLSMEDMLMLLKPYGYDTIGIDYLGLMSGMDGDDQWRKLGSSTRFAARFGNINHTTVIILAQLSDKGEIRYSRAIQEHAALMWQWVTDANSRESGIITIQQPKARQLEAFDFPLQIDFSRMKVGDLSAEVLKAVEKSKKRPAEDAPQKNRSVVPTNKRRDSDVVYQM